MKGFNIIYNQVLFSYYLNQEKTVASGSVIRKSGRGWLLLLLLEAPKTIIWLYSREMTHRDSAESTPTVIGQLRDKRLHLFLRVCVKLRLRWCSKEDSLSDKMCLSVGRRGTTHGECHAHWDLTVQ